MSQPETKYTFVWWGDGFFVYSNGRYIGKDDQNDLVQLMEQAGIATIKSLPAKWDGGLPMGLEDFDDLRDGMHDDIEEVDYEPV